MNVLQRLQTTNSLDQICNLSSLHFLLSTQQNDSNECLHFEHYSPKGFPQGFSCRQSDFNIVTFFLTQPITYTVSLCLATGSNHRINSLNGMSQSHAAHKWASQSHQLTPTLTLTYQPCEEKITSDVIDIDLLCVLCLTIILKITWTDHL